MPAYRGFAYKDIPLNDILYEVKEEVGYITLNRPEKLNAMKHGLHGIEIQILRVAHEAANDPKVKVVVVKGNGRCFSAGYDVTRGVEKQEQPGDEGGRPWMWKGRGEMQAIDHWEREQDDRYIWIESIWKNTKPFIAQVHGFCLAGGLDLANACDVIIAAEDAVFGYPAVRWGSMSMTPTWWLTVGMHKAKEMMLTGNMLTAQEMYNFGMVNRVVPGEKLEEEVRRLSDAMRLMPMSGQTMNKWAVNHYYDALGLQSALDIADAYDAIVHASPSPEGDKFNKIAEEQGLKAALEWRDARFAALEGKAVRDLRARKH